MLDENEMDKDEKIISEICEELKKKINVEVKEGEELTPSEVLKESIGMIEHYCNEIAEGKDFISPDQRSEFVSTIYNCGKLKTFLLEKNEDVLDLYMDVDFDKLFECLKNQYNQEFYGVDLDGNNTFDRYVPPVDHKGNCQFVNEIIKNFVFNYWNFPFLENGMTNVDKMNEILNGSRGLKEYMEKTILAANKAVEEKEWTRRKF